MDLAFNTLLLISSLVAVVIWLFSMIYNNHNFFKRYNIPFPRSIPLIGTFSGTIFGKCAFFNNIIEVYNRHEVRDKPFVGIFLFYKPAIMIIDTELIKKIMIEDFHHFSVRHAGTDTHDPIGSHSFFAIKNPELWKTVRGKFTPFFSSAKLKMMFYLVNQTGDDLLKYINRQLDSDNKVELEMRDLSLLYIEDGIASCFYGVEGKSLETPGELHEAAESFSKMTLWRSFEFSIILLLPAFTKFFGCFFFSKKLMSYVQRVISDVVAERVKTGNKRFDLIDFFVKTKSENVSMNLSDDVLQAQAATFLIAGTETSGSTQSFALYELAKNSKTQSRLRSEIKEALTKSNGEVTYDVVMNEMPFLEQVVMEALRLYVPSAVHERMCIKRDGYSLEPYSKNFKIPHMMPIYIPVSALHRDEKYFPDPLKFDPDRFSRENINNIQPFTYLPFGAGPRNCIGERFGLMQVKTGIVKILSDFRLEMTANTPTDIILEKGVMAIKSEKGLFLNLVKDPLL